MPQFSTPSSLLRDQGLLVEFGAAAAVYQHLCMRLDALQAHRVAAEHLTAAFEEEPDSPESWMRLIRDARTARTKLRRYLRDLIGLAAGDGAPKATVVERIRTECDALVRAGTLHSDAAFIEEVTSWVLEDYPMQRIIAPG
jgi:hypothetical protein